MVIVLSDVDRILLRPRRRVPPTVDASENEIVFAWVLVFSGPALPLDDEDMIEGLDGRMIGGCCWVK